MVAQKINDLVGKQTSGMETTGATYVDGKMDGEQVREVDEIAYRLAYRTAQEFERRFNLPEETLVESALLFVVKDLKKFDSKRKTSFIHFCAPRLRKRLTQDGMRAARRLVKVEYRDPEYLEILEEEGRFVS